MVERKNTKRGGATNLDSTGNNTLVPNGMVNDEICMNAIIYYPLQTDGNTKNYRLHQPDSLKACPWQCLCFR